MRIDEVLRAQGLDAFVERTRIKTARHGKYDNLVLLKYDMINCDMSDPAVQQCRGVIVDQERGYNIVSFPYTKFFNHGDHLAHNVNWATAKVFEKLDGSIMTMYYYDDQWMVQSNGMPDAAGNIGFSDQTFADLFWETFHAKGYKFPFGKLACFMFEMMTPKNRIVVRHEESRLVLHGARYLDDYTEICAEEFHANELGWEVVKTYPIDTLATALESVESVPGIEREGYVVCDHRFNRLKIKSKDYVRLHHLVSNVSLRRLLELAQLGEGDEFLGYFPEYTKEFNEVNTAMRSAMLEAALLYKRNEHHEDQKSFALAIKDSLYSGALFAMRSGKIDSIEGWFRTHDARRLLVKLGFKDKPDED